MGKIKKQSISPLQRWARRRNWEHKVLFNPRGIEDELMFRYNIRWKEGKGHDGKVIRTQTMSDEEIQLIKEILDKLNTLNSNWRKTHNQLKKEIDFEKFV